MKIFKKLLIMKYIFIRALKIKADRIVKISHNKCCYEKEYFKTLHQLHMFSDLYFLKFFNC